MPAPSMTPNAAGNLLASVAIPAGGSTTFTVDASSKFEVQIQIAGTFGAISTTAGLQVDVGRRIGTGAVPDTNPFSTLVIPAVAGTRGASIPLSTGRYTVKLSNLDITNGVSGVSATGDTLDAIA